jgi:hypothetical protein
MEVCEAVCDWLCEGDTDSEALWVLEADCDVDDDCDEDTVMDGVMVGVPEGLAPQVLMALNRMPRYCGDCTRDHGPLPVFEPVYMSYTNALPGLGGSLELARKALCQLTLAPVAVITSE